MVADEQVDSPDLGLIVKALTFAAQKHRDQRRKGADASPYINHPIALADVLCNEAGVTDRVTICAALLHDTVEDTETTAAEIEQAFGPEICGVVMEVTDDKGLPKLERKRQQVENAGKLSPRARLVKLADKISNLRDILSHPPADWPLERQQLYFDWAKAVIDGLRGTNARLEAEFDRVYSQRPE